LQKKLLHLLTSHNNYHLYFKILKKKNNDVYIVDKKKGAEKLYSFNY